MPNPEAVVPPDRVYTLDDLESWTFAGPSLAVLGQPVTHSLSPIMHRAALAELSKEDSKFARWSYFRFAVDADDLESALPRFHAKGFLGLNLTVPHKVRAVELVKSIDPSAREMGAVNTLVAQEEGYAGYNTDGEGLSHAVREELGRPLKDREVVLMGAGGAARAIAVQLLKEGCRKLWIGNRNPQRLHELMKALQPPFVEEAPRVVGFAFDEIPETLPEAPLIINATTQGLKKDDSLPMSLDHFGDGTQIYDTTYGCANIWRRTADARSWDYADGLAMLVAQGAFSLQRWTGKPVRLETMRAAVALALAPRLA
ncbi:MAG: shikimate dehydrogenase [Puniceicoccaceae bacterium 5H]|nr:MAG: shikimate dehydrogenase [Puniceicoccaceae bacterium 5H]